MIKTSDFKYPQKAGLMESKASAEFGFVKAASQDGHLGGGTGARRSPSGSVPCGEFGRPSSMKRASSDGIRYCRLVTDTFDDYGRPLRCYSVLAFKLEDNVVVDSAFIYDVTRSRLRFERLIRVVRREQLDPLQLRYLVEDMLGAGLL